MKSSVGMVLLATLSVISIAASGALAQPQWSLDTVIATGAYSSGIALTPDGSKLVVTQNTNPGSVSIVSTSDYAISPIDISAIESYPNGVAIAPDGLTALVATTHNVVFIDLSTKSIATHFAAPCAGTTLYGIAVSPNGQNAMFPDLSAGCTQQGLRVISVASPSGSTFDQVTTSGVLYAIALARDSGSAVVTTFTSDTPKRINLGTGGVQNISGFSGSYGVAALHHSDEMLIQGDSLKRVSLATNAATKFLSEIYSTALQGIAITADDHYAFVVGSFEKVILDLTRDTIIQTFTAGGTGVAAMPDGSRFFVTDSYNGTTRVYKKVNPTGVEQPKGVEENPTEARLLQNYPNPFNPSTTIQYTVAGVRGQGSGVSNVGLSIYDVLGREVATLVNGRQAPGSYEVRFDGSRLPSGVYFYELRAGATRLVRSMVLAK